MTRLVHCDEWQPIGIKDFEDNALKVVRATKHFSVIAGPGAGKTELLAQRACYLLQTGECISPKRILAISFKRDAAKNLKDRVNERCPLKLSTRFDSLTFDAFAKGLLDRFRDGIPELWKPSHNYEISFLTYRTIPDFFATLGNPPPQVATMAELQAVRHNTFEKEHIVGVPLPMNGLSANNAASWAAHIWWQKSLSGGVKSRLTFPMIGRLVELMLRANPLICAALRATYSHVFMDEFQDTTRVQYDLVKTAFGSSNAILTAVGDNKQQIMRWAMAMEDPFGELENDFGAERVVLVRNYRSSPELVRMQHHLAVAVDPASAHVTSMVDTMVPDDACAIMEFDTPETEAYYLAQKIVDGMKAYNLKPRDFAILVRQKPSDYESTLVAALRGVGVKARVEIELQDLLTERLTTIIIKFLRFGASTRAAGYWTECHKILAHVRGVYLEDERDGKSLNDDLGSFHRIFNRRLKQIPDSTDQVKELLRIVVRFVGIDNIKLLYPEYRQGAWFDEVLDSIARFIAPICQNHKTWSAALDEFEGLDSVPIITVHKSKGLEYHTVIFVGLDDSAWWSFRSQPEEARSTFFVAFSRAKQQVRFTYCEQRGGRSEIASLYGILRAAGVPTHKILDGGG